MPVTITASGNSTPPANTVIATRQVGSQEYQQFIQTDNSGSPIGQAAASPFHVAAQVTNRAGSAAGSPLFVSTTNAAGSAAGSPLFVSACVTNLAGSAAGSPLFTSVTNQVSASISNTVTVAQGASGASPWGVRVLDAAGNAYGVGSGSPLYITGGAAGGTSATDKAVYAEGTTSFTPVGGLFTTTAVALTASQSGAVRMTANRGLHANLRDSSGNELGNGVASPLFVSACVTNAAGSAAGSPLFASITNGVSASISGGSVALLAGANTIGAASAIQSGAWSVAASIVNSPSVVVVSAVASPVFASITNSGGSAAGSPLFVSASITNLAGSAAGSPLFASITNLAGSAAGSPLFTSVTNQVSASVSGGSVALLAGANVIGVASAIQGTPNSNTNGWPVKVTDGTNIYGVPGSPFSVAGVANQVYWAGSLLTVNNVDLSASISGCTLVVASTAGFAIVIVAATFTTSSCQRIGWTACGNNGGASAQVQTPMPFGTNGGMDANRLPHGHLWTFPSGSKAVLTTTSACYVAGTLDYLLVAS